MIVRTITEMVTDAREICVIDVREQKDYETETYPGAVHIFWEDFMEHLEDVPKNRPVYLLCYSGRHSEEIAEKLQPDGYEIYSVEGGYYSWLRLKIERFMQDEKAAEERCREIERSLIKKFRKELRISLLLIERFNCSNLFDQTFVFFSWFVFCFNESFDDVAN